MLKLFIISCMGWTKIVCFIRKGNPKRQGSWTSQWICSPGNLPEIPPKSPTSIIEDMNPSQAQVNQIAQSTFQSICFKSNSYVGIYWNRWLWRWDSFDVSFHPVCPLIIDEQGLYPYVTRHHSHWQSHIERTGFMEAWVCHTIILPPPLSPNFHLLLF